VSVLVPFRDEERYIDECFASILEQSFVDFEVVLVDDHSSDGSADIVRAHAKRDSRVRLCSVGSGSGLVSALNAGLAKAHGEYIARMDADDIMHAERLVEQYEYMAAHPDVSVVGSLVEVFPRESVTENMQYYIDWLNSLVDNESITRDIFIESPLAHPSVMLRRDEVIGLGGYSDNGMPEDYDLWLRYYRAGKKFHKIKRVLHYWREREDRHSRMSEVYSQENFLRLKSGYLAETVLRDKKEIYIWGAGRDGKSLFVHLSGCDLDIRGFIDVDSKKISKKVCGLKVISYTEIKELQGFIVVCVGTKGIRAMIREKLLEYGFCEGKDYVCTA